jgi:hypothetical protein
MAPYLRFTQAKYGIAVRVVCSGSAAASTAAVERDSGEETVVEHALEDVRVVRCSGRELHAPHPVHQRDRGAGLGVREVRGQFEGVA